MSKFCTTCGFQDCKCKLTYSALNYSNVNYSVPVANIRQLSSVKNDHPETLRSWIGICEDSEVTAKNVRKAVFWTVSSIQTRTEILDSVTDIPLNDFQLLKESVQNTTDGKVKWDKLHAFWTSSIPQDVANNANKGNWVKVMAILAGLSDEYEDASHDNYLRVVKASLVAEILGDPHALCLDSARREVLTPLLREMFPEKTNTTHVGSSGTYRCQGIPSSADPAWPGSQRFIEDWLARNPEEYRAITCEILDTLTQRTGMGRREASHALFILGNSDGATGHESLAEMLDMRD